MRRSLLIVAVVPAALLGWVARAEAACAGKGQAWICPAGSTVNDVQSAVDGADDGATITFDAGAYSWNSTVGLSNDRGVTLMCANAGACKVTVGAGTVVSLNGTLSGMNTKLYRVSGFTFEDAPAGALVIWFWGPGTLTQVRVDHNTFQNFGDAAISIAFGESGTVGSYFGVLDHNTATGPSNFLLLHVFGGQNDSPPPSPKGTANNMFVEDNTMAFTTITNTGAGCADSWGGAAIVWRHNKTTNCLVTSHGVVHNGGPFNYELYENSFNADPGAVGSEDCYRCFHHQGSGEFIAFNNTFTAAGGKNGSALAMTHYRSAAANVAGYGDPPGRCDGTKNIDGNRMPNATYHGYPCWRQPGRDGSGGLQPMYVWNNRWSDNGGKVDMNVENPWGAANPSVDDHVAGNRDYYNAVSASAQTSPASPFDGTKGMGFGTLANRPPTCTTNPIEQGGGVGYFATDDGPQGTLYRCSATNTWTVQYKPYAYPHPLAGGPPVGPGVDGGSAGSAGAGGSGNGGNGGGGNGSSSTSGCGCSVPGDDTREVPRYFWVCAAVLSLLLRRARLAAQPVQGKWGARLSPGRKHERGAQ